MKKTLFFILAVATVVTVIIFLRKSGYFPSMGCHNQEIFDSEEFHGVVKRIYIDYENHSSPMIQVYDIRTGQSVGVSFPGEKTGIYDLFYTGDTIRKDAGSNLITKEYNGLYLDLGRADFGCKE